MVRSPQKTEGAIRTTDLYDSTAILASYKMVSGIFTYLMPVRTHWFGFTAVPPELNDEHDIVEWMSIATALTHEEIWRSNFMREMFITIRSMVVFGTGVISVEKIDNEIVFKSHHIGFMFFDDNSKGDIDTVYRQIFYTARQALQEFGKEALADCKDIQKAIKKGRLNDIFEFVHVCAPNKDFDPSLQGSSSKRVKSVYIYIKQKKIVKEGGFDELPYLVARFARVPQEIMGRSPAIEYLPEIKMLNRMKRTFIESAEKACNPPLIVEDDGVVGQPVTSAQGMIYMRTGAMEPKPLQTGVNVELNAELIAQQQEIVRNAFFNDLFQALAQRRNMTATEVIERKEEKIVHLAPAVTSLQKEIFSPLILNLLLRAKRIPQPPVSFDFDIIYQGLLALAMSNVQANAMEAQLAKWEPTAQLRPEIFDNVDFDKAFRKSWVSGGAPAEVLKDYDDMLAEREQTQQLQIAAAQAEIGESASKALKNVNQTIEPRRIHKGRERKEARGACSGVQKKF
jgi:hypothetical protein